MRKFLSFNPEEGKWIVQKLDDGGEILGFLYNIINCNIVERVCEGYNSMVGFEYDIILDEEGKIKRECLPTMLYYNDLLVGTLVFTRVDEEGDWVGLSDKEISDIINSYSLIDLDKNDGSKTITMLVKKDEEDSFYEMITNLFN